MSSLKSGRRRKILNLKGCNIVPTEVDSVRFESVLLELGGDPSKWSLKMSGYFFIKRIFARPARS